MIFSQRMYDFWNILNNKNKWVYQKRFDCVDGKGYIDLKWNGKASKNNEAGVKATYVKNGTYKVQVIMSYNNGSYQKTVKKTKSFKVSRKAPAGTKGIAKKWLANGAQPTETVAKLLKVAGIEK